jgi:hypothetical protein
MTKQINEIISSITSIINIHLNFNQTMTKNTNSLFFSLEKTSSDQLEIIDNNDTLLLRVSVVIIIKETYVFD